MSQRYLILVLLIPLDAKLKDVPKCLETQSNLNTFFHVEMSKNNFSVSKSFRMNHFKIILLNVRTLKM